MTKALRLLVVEDSQDDTDLLLLELQRAGHEPIWARVESAEAMRAELSARTWDLVVSDFSMPHFDIFEALALLHATGLDLPFIIVSGTIGEDYAVKAMRAGAHDYILKDNLRRLTPAIERELREARVRAEQRQAAAEIALLNAKLYRFKDTLNQTLDAIFIWREDTLQFTYVNFGAQQQSGYSEADLLQMTALDIDLSFSKEGFRHLVKPLIEGEQTSLTVESTHRHKDGYDIPIEARLQYVQSRSGTSDFVAVVRDIRARKQAEETIHRLAYMDLITGLPNRTRFQELAQEAIAMAQSQRRSVGLLLIDLEHFKEVNDTLGHNSGDRLLQKVGLRIREALFTPDVVARIGGDEFGILLPHLAEASDVSHAVNKIQHCLHQPFVIDGVPIVVEASIGVATMPEHGDDANTLLQRADIAMYNAKQMASGYAIYSADRDPYSPERLGLMAELRAGIDNSELVLHFQPKIDLNTREVIGMEALVRWQHPRRGLLFPDKFIDAAEHTGLMAPLTRWVLAAALNYCQDLRGQGIELRVSVNLSARSLHDPHLLDWVGNALRASAAQPQQLMLEITESAIVLDPQRAEESLVALSQLGVGISIDDFGTGYTSLASIRRLPIDEIKIDRSFITDMLADKKDSIMAHAIIDLGRNLGLKVVAEGVENQVVLNALKALGCDQAQGYFISKPLTGESLRDWFAASAWKAATTAN